MNRADDDIILYAVGDIGPDRPDPGSIFQNVTGVLSQGDVTFCHLEINLSNRGVGPHGKEVARNPKIAAAMKEAGFDVVSFAGNHCLAAGIDAFHDTIKYLKEQNFQGSRQRHPYRISIFFFSRISSEAAPISICISPSSSINACRSTFQYFKSSAFNGRVIVTL